MTNVVQNINSIKALLPEDITLVAVSKTKPNTDVLDAYNTGHRIFGENKVQDLVRKSEELPRDINWHFIGHLQTNKVKYIAPFVDLIHAVDSLKLLKMINKEAAKNKRIINCLLQCKIAEEDTKFGLSESDLNELLSSSEFKDLNHISIRGTMGMATNTDDELTVRNEFKLLKEIFERTKLEYFTEKPEFNVLSMGMSHDYKLAIDEGATMIRVGSSIFGERNYLK